MSQACARAHAISFWQWMNGWTCCELSTVVELAQRFSITHADGIWYGCFQMVFTWFWDIALWVELVYAFWAKRMPMLCLEMTIHASNDAALLPLSALYLPPALEHCGIRTIAAPPWSATFIQMYSIMKFKKKRKTKTKLNTWLFKDAFSRRRNSCLGFALQ